MWDFYRKRYKKMMLIPLLIAIPMLFLVFVYPGIAPGVDLTGGNVIILQSSKNITEAQLTTILKENFNLLDLKVFTISSPTGFGARVEYSKDPLIANVEGSINNAITHIDDENVSIAYSNSALKLLGQQEQQFANSKTALAAAQGALAAYNDAFSKKLEDTLSQKLGLGDNAEFQTQDISPTLGAAAFQSSAFVGILGVILITIVVFIAFRQFVPSGAIVQAMLFDILSGAFGMALFHIPFSLTTLPALLLLIGYSIDTDIMLTSRMLKGKDGSHGERATEAMKTGITMTSTTMMALIAMIIVSYFYQIEVIYQISVILFFGLIGDMISTWFMNAPILLWFLHRRDAKRGY
jgi:preprotein translocase subunit SecF